MGVTHQPPDGLDALGGEVTFLLQLLHDALALLVAVGGGFVGAVTNSI